MQLEFTSIGALSLIASATVGYLLGRARWESGMGTNRLVAAAPVAVSAPRARARSEAQDEGQSETLGEGASAPSERDAARLAHERSTLMAVLDAAPVGILVEGADGRIDLVNRAGLQHIASGDPEDWLGASMADLVANLKPRINDASEKSGRVREAKERGEVLQDLELVLYEPSEAVILLSVSPVYSSDGEQLGRVWLSRDVTEARQLEDQLRHSQKLETIGTLSGGIAHDFNNQLAVILGNVRYARRSLGEQSDVDPDTIESLIDLERAADHCAQLTQSLLAFARRAPVSIQSLNTVRVVDDVVELLRPLIPSSIEISIEVEAGLRQLAADPTQIQQVMLNLAVNARDAMKERGEISIGARSREVGEAESRGIVGARPGDFIELSVSDTGCGLDPDAMERIFEPFFTTKPIGQGTGLGLAIVHGVVTAHQGWIEVESDPGNGSTFRVILPLATESSDGVELPQRTDSVAGGETILVADDEPSIRRLVRLDLSRRGYEIVEAADGAEAVDCFREREGEIDLVLMDLTMPVLDGLAARSEILKLAPGTPVLLTSGHPPESVSTGQLDGLGFLHKPYPLDQLALRIRSLLDGR